MVLLYLTLTILPLTTYSVEEELSMAEHNLLAVILNLQFLSNWT